MRPTVINLLNVGEWYLRRAGVLSCRISSERLLEHVIRIHEPAFHRADSRDYGVAGLYLERSRNVGREERKAFFDYLRKRAKRYPLQYLVGEAHFMDFAFRVDERCLIPRPETELLVEEVLREIRRIVPSGEARILDVGTGCGNIAISLARYLPFADVWAADWAADILKLAEENAVRLDMFGRVKFVESNLFDAFPDMRFECIVSNPPYLSSKDMQALPGELFFEPKEALFGGERGTEFMSKLIGEAERHLVPGGLLCFEAGMGQSGEMERELSVRGYERIRLIADYAGIERVVLAYRGEH